MTKAETVDDILAVETEMRAFVLEKAQGVSPRWYGPTLWQISRWADRLAVLWSAQLQEQKADTDTRVDDSQHDTPLATAATNEPVPTDDDFAGWTPEFTVWLVRRGLRSPMFIDSVWVDQRGAETRATLIGKRADGWHVEKYQHTTGADSAGSGAPRTVNGGTRDTDSSSAILPVPAPLEGVQPLPWTPRQYHGLFAIYDLNEIMVCEGLSEQEAVLICSTLNSLPAAPPVDPRRPQIALNRDNE